MQSYLDEHPEAFSNGWAGIGYHFEAYGYNLTFNRRPHLGHAAEYWSSGISVLESC